MTPREQEIRDWADGSYPDGKPHIPDGCESFTRDLLAIIDREREESRTFDAICAKAMWRIYDRHVAR